MSVTDVSRQGTEAEPEISRSIYVKFPLTRRCRVCSHTAFMVFEDSRRFYVCKNCRLMFTECTISLDEIQKHYQRQYVTIVDWHKEAQALLEIVRFAVSPNKIFDFGSGSGALTDAFRSMGFEVGSYEPMLHGDFRAERYDSDYDLVILNEVIEHVEDIMQLFDNICSVIRIGGIIFISTFMTDTIFSETNKFQGQFRDWWYKDDPTHVSFFCKRTYEYICTMKTKYQLQILFAGTKGVILQRIY